MHFDERVVTGEKPHKPKYWYFYHIWFCPPCGDEEVYKERRYTPKPSDWDKRHSWTQHMCYGCQISMFL